MNKKIMLLGTISVLVAVSCGLMKKNGGKEAGQEAAIYQKGDLKKSDEKTLRSGIEDKPKLPEQPGPTMQPSMPEPEPKPDRPNPSPKPLTQYDSKALDEKVRIAAKKANQDVTKFRLLVRSDHDGAEVYRMLGMHVIVSPMGEETYLPDEI